MSSYPIYQIHHDDNVAVALQGIATGEAVAIGSEIVIVEKDIPMGHKIALRTIATGEPVVKYGYRIGRASQRIEAGAWVHSHNFVTALSGKEAYAYKPVDHKAIALPADLPAVFDGYVRDDGQVGIRNEIWILNTVGCINKSAEHLARMAEQRFAGNGIDGVYHFAHPYGCSQLGDDLSYTQRILADLVNHPNAAGVLVLGLGCENNHIAAFQGWLGDINAQRVKFLSAQAVDDELDEGMKLLEEIANYARTFTRTKIPVTKLRVGMKCGGSDGLSGITANPLVGAVSDKLVATGGTVFLTEVPEMFGAETMLMNRAKDAKVYGEIVSLINNFKDYYERHGQPIYENPSPGNKDGGITTLEEKSLGCVQKGGASLVSGVLAYGEQATQNGLQLIQAPGNDMVSVTALSAAGAHMVLFTTGRGTPLGGPVPTVKISTNTALYQRKRNWIDFDAGGLATSGDMQKLSDALYRYVIDVASGRVATCNEQNGFREIAIFKDGVTL